jgi:hypothetical protein
MRTTREETIRQYADQYLQGKSEAQRQDFYSKPVERQYANIMAWKRRAEKRREASEEMSLDVADVIKHARSLTSLIDLTGNMTQDEMRQMHEAVDAAKHALDNYYRVRNTRELQALKRQQEEIQRRIDQLRYEGADE